MFDTPGGGGMGLPEERDPEKVQSDIESGLVTSAGAGRDYDAKGKATESDE
jgi:N-methylhydantoinase B/oxoprolinase/acetone carboxylase alpha subunit